MHRRIFSNIYFIIIINKVAENFQYTYLKDFLNEH